MDPKDVKIDKGGEGRKRGRAPAWAKDKPPTPAQLKKARADAIKRSPVTAEGTPAEPAISAEETTPPDVDDLLPSTPAAPGGPPGAQERRAEVLQKAAKSAARAKKALEVYEAADRSPPKSPPARSKPTKAALEKQREAEAKKIGSVAGRFPSLSAPEAYVPPKGPPNPRPKKKKKKAAPAKKKKTTSAEKKTPAQKKPPAKK